MLPPGLWIAVSACWGVCCALGGAALSTSNMEPGGGYLAFRSDGPADSGSSTGDDAGRDGEGSRAGERSGGPRGDVLRIVVSSGRCVGSTKPEAVAELEKAVAQERAERLRRLGWDLARVQFSSAEVVQEWAWLVQQTGVEEHVDRDVCQVKDYGWIAERELIIEIPYQVLAAWTARLQDRFVHRWQGRLAAAAGTVFAAVLAIAGAVFLDRKTGGYYRGVLVTSIFVTLALIAAAFWVGVLWKMI